MDPAPLFLWRCCMAYYGKLPIVLLSELAAGKEDSNNCRIARYLLERLD